MQVFGCPYGAYQWIHELLDTPFAALFGKDMSRVSYVSIGNVIIDDIVLPDGVTHMGVLGGGGTHAIVGMRIWTDEIGFVAAVGSDLLPECREALEAYNIDLSGIVLRSSYQTARAWQIFEWDERRFEIFRTEANGAEV